jgi:hypothetical protein
MRRILTGTIALCLAASAGILSGRGLAAQDESLALVAADAGLGNLRRLLADVIYIRADQYYHMAMYRGEDWARESDYLPVIWLVVKLRPGFEAAYSEGAYQLVVNLRLADEGFRLLERGMRECPGSLELRWQNFAIRWQAGFGTLEQRRQAGRDFLAFIRRSRSFEGPTDWEKNAFLIQSWLFQEDSTRSSAQRLASLYERRSRVIETQRTIWGRALGPEGHAGSS